ncbi:unnamed protein product [Cuscuta campestris]|nr:unnamed protein product [Cuscuta campestris]
MLMEAVLESLKDIEVAGTAHAESNNSQPETLHTFPDSSSSTQSSAINELPAADGHNPAKEAKTSETSPRCENSIAPVNESPTDCANGNASKKETESSNSGTPQSSSSSDHNNAKVTAVKNPPSNNRGDGLVRCWDLGFFKSR